MPLPSVDQFIGTNVTEQGFKNAQKQLVEYVGNEVPTNTDLNNVSANLDAKITPKADKTYVDSAVAAVAGGHKAYATLAAAQAAQASLPTNSIVEVTNDPDATKNGTYQWNGTTLTKSAYDPLTQAKSYTDSKFDVISPLIDQENNLNDLYVSVTTGSIFSEAGSIINVFPVTGGQVHAVKSSSYDVFSFSIATRTTNSIATGATQGKVTLTDTLDPSIKLFTPPLDAKYAFITVKKGATFDIRADVKANIGTDILTNAVIKKLDGVNVLSSQIKTPLGTSDLLDVKLYNPLNIFTNKYARYDTGAITTATEDYRMAVFPVTGGKTYVIKSSSYAPNFFAISTRNTASVAVGDTQGKVTLVDTSDPTVKTFTVPADAVIGFITVKIGTGFDIRTGLQINEGTTLLSDNAVGRIAGKLIFDIEARERVKVLERDMNNLTSPLKSKTWGAYGDSITAAAGCYAEILAARHGATLVKKAISGAKLHFNPTATEVIMSDVWDTTYALPYETDIITVAIGTNDYMGYNTLGTMADRVTTTFYGALHVMIGGLRTKYANSRIGFISQIPRENIRISANGTNDESKKQRAIKEVCEYYSIPLFESYKDFGFNPTDNSAMKTALMPDGLHPSAAGHTWYANRIEDFILNLAR